MGREDTAGGKMRHRWTKSNKTRGSKAQHNT